MKYLSLFSGIGGFELGIGQQHECIGYSEIDKYAIQVYNKHFNHKNYGDATKIDTRELPDFDLLVGGFPCQAFSIAGKRRGFDEARGTLFFDIARILADKKPRHFILENVKGLLSHDGGRTFTTIIRILSSMGYFVEWQVLNAKNFGVPQNRERVFIVGHLGGQPRRKVFPIGEDDNNVVGEIRQKLQTFNVARCLTSTEHKQHGDGNYIFNSEPKPSEQSTQQGGNISDGSNSRGGQTHPTDIRAVLTPDRPTKRQNGRRMKENGEPSFTLTGQDIHGVAIIPTILRGRPRYENGKRELKMYEYDKCPTVGTNVGQGDQKNMLNDGMRIRRLTPMECERLMSYPDGWTEYGVDNKGQEVKISDTQRYKMAGNGIVSNCVEEVVRRLK